MIKLTPFQRFCQGAGIHVKGKTDQELGVLVSRAYSEVGLSVAIASRRGGKAVDVVIEVQGRWMNSAYDIAPDPEEVRSLIEQAQGNYARVGCSCDTTYAEHLAWMRHQRLKQIHARITKSVQAANVPEGLTIPQHLTDAFR